MKKSTAFIFAAGLLLAILISNCFAVIRDGRRLDQLRGSVLRLHILADSDDPRDQWLKLQVRDSLLESGIFDGAQNLDDAQKIAEKQMSKITRIAEDTLRRYGCDLPVTAELADVDFDERVYGDITMPAGKYRALRVKIGSAQGHNWWCVMYPPLCLPAAIDETTADENATVAENKSAEELFTDDELDILYRPQKYRIRFAIWDKFHELTADSVHKNNDVYSQKIQ